MNPLQNLHYKNLVPPGALIDNTALTPAELDTVVSGVKYDYAIFLLIMGATDIALTAAKFTDSDAAGSGHADITGTRYGTDDDIAGSTSVLPSATDDDKIFAWQVDLTKRKRYLNFVITVGDGTQGGYYTLIAILGRGDAAPITAALANLGNILRV